MRRDRLDYAFMHVSGVEGAALPLLAEFLDESHKRSSRPASLVECEGYSVYFVAPNTNSKPNTIVYGTVSRGHGKTLDLYVGVENLRVTRFGLRQRFYNGFQIIRAARMTIAPSAVANAEIDSQESTLINEHGPKRAKRDDGDSIVPERNVQF